jgi:exoribonuclease R
LKAIRDKPLALAEGISAIRTQFQLPGSFPPGALEEAITAVPSDPHVDRTALPMVTLDPLSSTDLDQAFVIEAAGSDLILRYAIADIGNFLRPGGPIETEAWKRGETIYLPDGKVALYPPRLCEDAASLLPTGDRPAILFTVRIDPDGNSKLDGAERALVRSRAKLGYATVTPEQLSPEFFELARRITANEDARGASRVDPPQQEVVEQDDGSFTLAFRPISDAEQANAALSLAANLAIAGALYEHQTGLFRVMPGPDHRAERRIRNSARALGVEWPADEELRAFQRRLDPNDRREASLMLAIRRAGTRASYAPYHDGERPWHWAMAATYVHATAPLRRLADRYVTECALAVANGRAVPDWVTSAFERLPDVMSRADAKAAQIGSAVIELAEAVELQPHVGETFTGQITDVDERGTRVQLAGLAIITRVADPGAQVGDRVQLRLLESDPAQRRARFSLA